MDENKRILRVIDRTEDAQKIDANTEIKKASNSIAHPNQTNPIYKNLAKFSNSKIGDKLSINDLLR